MQGGMHAIAYFDDNLGLPPELLDLVIYFPKPNGHLFTTLTLVNSDICPTLTGNKLAFGQESETALSPFQRSPDTGHS
jgi:hypothetical protein